MTPTNTAMTPEIKNIADNNGDKHTVVPTPHTHSQDDVDGLAAALAAKLAKLTSFTAGNFVKVKSDGTLEDSGKKASDFADAAATATALAGKQATLTFDSTPTANSTNPVTSGGVFSELAKKLSKVEVTDLDDLSEITDSGLYGLCLNTSGSHTTSFEYFLMMVERSLPLITYTLISSTGYKKRTYHVSNGWVGNDWSEYVYATTEFKPDGIESMSTGGSAKIYTYISDLTGDGRIGIELEDHLGNNVEIEITPENIANLVRALANPDSTPTANSDNLVTSGGVKAALNTKANANHSHDSISSDEDNSVSVSDGAVIIELNDGETGGELEIPVEKLDNLQRAINNPDSTPTANSDNLVTSGGVKAAIDALAERVAALEARLAE